MSPPRGLAPQGSPPRAPRRCRAGAAQHHWPRPVCWGSLVSPPSARVRRPGQGKVSSPIITSDIKPARALCFPLVLSLAPISAVGDGAAGRRRRELAAFTFACFHFISFCFLKA